jgi:hypothetical protein
VSGRLACTGQARDPVTSLHRRRRPQAQVLEDASDDCRILDSSAMTRIGPLHVGAFQGIGLIDFADQPRPRSLGTGRNAVAGLLAWREAARHRRAAMLPLPAWPACPVRLPADIANEVLVAIGNVLAQQRQPLAHPASLGSSASIAVRVVLYAFAPARVETVTHPSETRASFARAHPLRHEQLGRANKLASRSLVEGHFPHHFTQP